MSEVEAEIRSNCDIHRYPSQQTGESLERPRRRWRGDVIGSIAFSSEWPWEGCAYYRGDDRV